MELTVDPSFPAAQLSGVVTRVDSHRTQRESWDHVFIARYPNAGAFLAMVTDPVYQQAVKHRQAAVLTRACSAL